MWGIRTRWVEHDSGGYWDYCDFPLRDADDEAVERLADALARRFRLRRRARQRATG